MQIVETINMDYEHRLETWRSKGRKGPKPRRRLHPTKHGALLPWPALVHAALASSRCTTAGLRPSSYRPGGGWCIVSSALLVVLVPNAHPKMCGYQLFNSSNSATHMSARHACINNYVTV
jgi:hypothetical protein